MHFRRLCSHLLAQFVLLTRIDIQAFDAQRPADRSAQAQQLTLDPDRAGDSSRPLLGRPGSPGGRVVHHPVTGQPLAAAPSPYPASTWPDGDYTQVIVRQRRRVRRTVRLHRARRFRRDWPRPRHVVHHRRDGRRRSRQLRHLPGRGTVAACAPTPCRSRDPVPGHRHLSPRGSLRIRAGYAARGMVGRIHGGTARATGREEFAGTVSSSSSPRPGRQRRVRRAHPPRLDHLYRMAFASARGSGRPEMRPRMRACWPGGGLPRLRDRDKFNAWLSRLVGQRGAGRGPEGRPDPGREVRVEAKPWQWLFAASRSTRRRPRIRHVRRQRCHPARVPHPGRTHAGVARPPLRGGDAARRHRLRGRRAPMRRPSRLAGLQHTPRRSSAPWRWSDDEQPDVPSLRRLLCAPRSRRDPRIKAPTVSRTTSDSPSSRSRSGAKVASRGDRPQGPHRAPGRARRGTCCCSLVAALWLAGTTLNPAPPAVVHDLPQRPPARTGVQPGLAPKGWPAGQGRRHRLHAWAVRALGVGGRRGSRAHRRSRRLHQLPLVSRSPPGLAGQGRRAHRQRPSRSPVTRVAVPATRTRASSARFGSRTSDLEACGDGRHPRAGRPTPRLSLAMSRSWAASVAGRGPGCGQRHAGSRPRKSAEQVSRAVAAADGVAYVGVGGVT